MRNKVAKALRKIAREDIEYAAAGWIAEGNAPPTDAEFKQALKAKLDTYKKITKSASRLDKKGENNE